MIEVVWVFPELNAFIAIHLFLHETSNSHGKCNEYSKINFYFKTFLCIINLIFSHIFACTNHPINGKKVQL